MKMRQANRGMTLMEILVVLVIIAIIAGFAVLSLSNLGGDTPQEKTARRIAELLQLASQNAVMESKQFGLEIQPHGYQFFKYNGSTWQPLKNDPVFRKRTVDDDVVLNLNLEGRRIALPKPATALPAIGTPAFASNATTTMPTSMNLPEETQKAHVPHPQILALSSGEITPFKLEVASAAGNSSYHIRGHMNGKIQLIPPDSRVLNR